MVPLTLDLACSSTGGDSEPASAGDLDYSLVFNSDGLPVCERSLSDDAICAGHGTTWPASDTTWAKGFFVPQAVTEYTGSVIIFAPAVQTSDFACATSEEDALAIEAEWSANTEGACTAAQTLDDRWYDVYLWAESNVNGLFRVPNCSHFADFTTMPHRWGRSGSWGYDPLWSVASLPPDADAFFDTARFLEFHRRENDDGGTDWTVLYAMGATGDETTWTFRSCRIDGQPVQDGVRYAHTVSQNDYVMDVATGIVTFTGTAVRTVTCDSPLLQYPDW